MRNNPNAMPFEFKLIDPAGAVRFTGRAKRAADVRPVDGWTIQPQQKSGSPVPPSDPSPASKGISGAVNRAAAVLPRMAC
jgi:hypothetical protein